MKRPELKLISASNQSSPKAIVFVHGFPDGPEGFKYQQQDLKDDFTLASIAHTNWDKVSSLSSALLSLSGQIDKELSGKEVYFCGHDIGVPLMFALSEVLQEKVKGLIMIAGLPAEAMARRLFSKTDWKQKKSSWYIAPFLFPKLAKKIWPLASKNLEKKHAPESLSPRHPRGAESQEMIALYSKIFQDWNQQGRPKMVNKSTPLLGIFSGRDPFIVPPTKDEVSSWYSGPITLRGLPSGHWPHIDFKNECNQYLRLFINQ